jgi:hypothetical protein
MVRRVFAEVVSARFTEVPESGRDEPEASPDHEWCVRAVHLEGWPPIAMGPEPGFLTGLLTTHPAELRARSGSCRIARLVL